MFIYIFDDPLILYFHIKINCIMTILQLPATYHTVPHFGCCLCYLKINHSFSTISREIDVEIPEAHFKVRSCKGFNARWKRLVRLALTLPLYLMCCAGDALGPGIETYFIVQRSGQVDRLITPSLGTCSFVITDEVHGKINYPGQGQFV